MLTIGGISCGEEGRSDLGSTRSDSGTNMAPKEWAKCGSDALDQASIWLCSPEETLEERESQEARESLGKSQGR